MIRRDIAVLVLLIGAWTGSLTGQATRPELTDAQETSTYSDVLGFLDSLVQAGADLRIGTLAHSVEGRAIPWVLAARPMVDGPATAHRSGKPVVYIQGNIHAGEVEGKEAALMLLRDMTLGSLSPAAPGHDARVSQPNPRQRDRLGRPDL
jgi:hypothetical protein